MKIKNIFAKMIKDAVALCLHESYREILIVDQSIFGFRINQNTYYQFCPTQIFVLIAVSYLQSLVTIIFEFTLVWELINTTCTLENGRT